MNAALRDLSASFNDDNDKLKPISALSVLLNNQKSDEILTNVSKWQSITDYGRAIAPVISAAYAIIAALIRLTTQ